jgi:DNA-binding response OmpR family regulator
MRPPEPQMPTDLPTVLVIDDEQSLLMLLKAIMSRAGFRVLLADNGADGERVAGEQRPDVIVCDVMMPPPDGFELRRRLAENPTTMAIPFIFLTARSSGVEKIFALENGASDYITKPFEREELIARVRAVLRGEGSRRLGAVNEAGV